MTAKASRTARSIGYYICGVGVGLISDWGEAAYLLGPLFAIGGAAVYLFLPHGEGEEE